MNEMANCKEIFFSYASEDHVEPKDRTVEPIVKELTGRRLETGSSLLHLRLKDKLRDTTNDTI
ncbi:MAG: hypothetical protein L0H75_11240, partial [Nitrosospira sp.]|nr:hypothetical protein [Nitrosospira sp.]